VAAPQDETERLLGLDPGDLGGTLEVAVWPENWAAITVFAAMQTQWTVGPSGWIGLRYEALPVVLDLLGMAGERAELFAGLRVMEREVLTVLRRDPAN